MGVAAIVRRSGGLRVSVRLCWLFTVIFFRFQSCALFHRTAPDPAGVTLRDRCAWRRRRTLRVTPSGSYAALGEGYCCEKVPRLRPTSVRAAGRAPLRHPGRPARTRRPLLPSARSAGLRVPPEAGGGLASHPECLRCASQRRWVWGLLLLSADPVVSVFLSVCAGYSR